MKLLIRKNTDNGRRIKYRSVKLYNPPLSPIEEEYTLQELLSRQSSALSRQSSIGQGEYKSEIIDYEINSDTYLVAVIQIMNEYNNDCAVYEEEKKIKECFEYLIELGDFLKQSFKKRDAQKVIKRIKTGLKKIRILEDECFVMANTQKNLTLIETFLENIIITINKNV